MFERKRIWKLIQLSRSSCFIFLFSRMLLTPTLSTVISREIVSSVLSTHCVVCFVVFSRDQLRCSASDQTSFIGPLGPKPQTSVGHFTYCFPHLVLFNLLLSEMAFITLEIRMIVMFDALWFFQGYKKLWLHLRILVQLLNKEFEQFF